METNLHRTGMVPRVLEYRLLENITNDFCEENKVGTGGYGTVYKVNFVLDCICILQVYILTACAKIRYVTKLDNSTGGNA